MKLIIDTLGLPAGATEADVVAALQVQRNTLADAQQEVGRLKSLAKALPEGITVEALKRKLDAGLDRDMAIDVLLDQVRHDATHPHDKPPRSGPVAQAQEELEQTSVEVLRQMAVAYRIEGAQDMKKAELVKELKKGPPPYV